MSLQSDRKITNNLHDEGPYTFVASHNTNHHLSLETSDDTIESGLLDQILKQATSGTRISEGIKRYVPGPKGKQHLGQRKSGAPKSTCRCNPKW